MKILQIMGCTSNQYSSTERYLVKKAELCRKNGHRLFVAYDTPCVDKDFKKDLIIAGGTLLALKWKSGLDLKAYVALRRTIRSFDINVVHAYFSPTRRYVIFYCFISGFKRRFMTATNSPFIGSEVNKLNKGISLFSKLKKRLLPFICSKVLCRSDGILQEYLSLGVSRKKLIVTSGGVDTDIFRKNSLHRGEYRKMLNLDIDKEIVIGVTCRLEKVKGIDVLIHAFSKIGCNTRSIAHEKIKLVIVGDGHERNELEHLVSSLGLKSSVKFLGHMKQVDAAINIFDIFVLPSYYEGMSNSLLEAMAMELPVVVTDIHGNQDIFRIANTQNIYIGETFKPGDVESLSTKIEILIDKHRNSTSFHRSKEIVERYFSVHNRVNIEIDSYGAY